MSDILYVVSGLLIGLAFQGGLFLFAIPFALVSLVLAWLNRPSLTAAKNPTATVPILRATRTTDATAVGRILRPAITQTGSIISTRDMVSANSTEDESSLAKLKGKEIWEKLDQELSLIYRPVLSALRALLPKSHSVVFFFRNVEGHFFSIRQFSSAGENEINDDPTFYIPDGAGIIGQLANRDVSRILEGDLPNGKSLGYYKSVPQIHSVAAVPCYHAEKQCVGALVVDSLETNAFNSSIISILESFASMFFMLTRKSCLSALNFIEKNKYYELAKYQQNFFKSNLLKDTYKEIFEYVNQNFISDRMMILVYDHPESEEGTVAFCRGEDEKVFEGMRFSFSDKGIFQLAMNSHVMMERSLHGREYVYRLKEGEPRNHALQYLFVQPSSMTMRNVVKNEPSEFAICLERREDVKLEQVEKDLLRFMVNIAYFAYQRGSQVEREQFEIYHDALTGLLNRRTIDERIVELNKVHQEKDVGVMMMDIDHFKHINDTYGHQAGDTILKGIASRIASVADKDDNLLARYGGEEFFVSIPGATQEILTGTAEKIREAVASAPFDIHQGAPIAVTVSIGCYLATREFHGEMKRAVSYADAALYNAKETGRNRVVEYQERTFATDKAKENLEGTSDVHNS